VRKTNLTTLLGTHRQYVPTTNHQSHTHAVTDITEQSSDSEMGFYTLAWGTEVTEVK